MRGDFWDAEHTESHAGEFSIHRVKRPTVLCPGGRWELYRENDDGFVRIADRLQHGSAVALLEHLAKVPEGSVMRTEHARRAALRAKGAH